MRTFPRERNLTPHRRALEITGERDASIPASINGGHRRHQTSITRTSEAPIDRANYWNAGYESGRLSVNKNGIFAAGYAFGAIFAALFIWIASGLLAGI